jgi:outer membrane biosynthesis protein TonB
MRLAILLFWGAFMLGQGASPSEQKANTQAATTQQESQDGDPGRNGAHERMSGNVEILSETQGVDFGPYLQHVLENVRKNWRNAIPESAQWKHGKVVIEFTITNDGGVAGMKTVRPDCGIIRLKSDSCGDVVLEHAAWSGITASVPFPPLPSDFRGRYLALRFRFFYNPDKSDLVANPPK